MSGLSLQGANLSGAALDETVMNGADLREMNLAGVDFSKINLNGVKLRGARAGHDTKWPANFDWRDAGVSPS
jgi:uncharacterized protein YjbI with pentapeptide repeats